MVGDSLTVHCNSLTSCICGTAILCPLLLGLGKDGSRSGPRGQHRICREGWEGGAALAEGWGVFDHREPTGGAHY